MLYDWAFLIPPGSMEWEVCLTLLHMSSNGNRTPGILILSAMLYPPGHMLPYPDSSTSITFFFSCRSIYQMVFPCLIGSYPCKHQTASQVTWYCASDLILCVLTLGDDKVSRLTHTCKHKPLRKIRWQSVITRLTGRFTWLAASPGTATTWVQCPGLAYRQFRFMPKMEIHTYYNSQKVTAASV